MQTFYKTLHIFTKQSSVGKAERHRESYSHPCCRQRILLAELKPGGKSRLSKVEYSMTGRESSRIVTT